MTQRWLMAWVLALVLAAPQVWAAQGGEGGDRGDTAREVIQNTSNRLIEAIREAQQKIEGGELDDEDKARFRRIVKQELGPIIDFQRIARLVMGRYYKQADEAQFERFVDAFRQSLIGTYSTGLAAYDDQKIEILPAKPGDVKKGQATVRMAITIDGDVYPVLYQMYEKSPGSWKLQNLIVNGINLGLQFRNQFAQAYKNKKGDIDAVIEQWQSDVDVGVADEDDGESGEGGR